MILQAAVEEGIVVGGGCTLLRLASKVDAIKATLDNDEEKVKQSSLQILTPEPVVFLTLLMIALLQVGADIVKRALSYPLKLIAKNAGVNGSVVSEKVITTDNNLHTFSPLDFNSDA